MNEHSYISRAKNIIDIEIRALQKLRDEIDDGFSQVINTISNCHGKTVVTGVGKSGHIARKVAATMASLGTSSFFLHPGDALHGDLGMITNNDVVIIISNSGESEEVLRLLPNMKLIGAKIIAITNNRFSSLAKHSDIICKIPVVDEACILKMAPTSSTTVTLVLGDALAVILSEINNFGKNQYAIFHPAGALGRRLTTRVSDIMHSGSENSSIEIGSTLKDAIVEISKKGLGAVTIIDMDGKLKGILTDGDIRRCMDNDINIYSCPVEEVMTKTPITVLGGSLAIDALIIMQKGGKKASVLPVVDENNGSLGLITASDILKLGIVY
ncbi:KpsF/GutQ family sugar-phosphate isomerase [Paenibacillus vini]|uniref:Arabinose 5-phosphate isomerase n=1 Tax=Paenibacillus vini TaxID=1476024 RepID=A0ABQ4MIR6_9BACL|nr:KpsF/GutQ family sugar-phosphate isomerase [Paenibacillus vini]GIP55873.1 arabinose 5-phosphate isomerase [Paenibacillus vini]